MDYSMIYILFIFSFVVLLTSAGIIFRLWQNQKQLKQEGALIKIEKEQLLNRINALELENSKFRLNPHLFKNTLNTIQGYAFRTHHAMEKLSSVLDYILYDSNVQYISLKQELEFAGNFIELNRIKLSPLFDFRLRISVNEAHPFYNEPLLSPLITAYFIENAFKHADQQSKDAFISIIFELNGDDFIFIVSNKINKKTSLSSNSGIGKENIKTRLGILYGDAYRLDYSITGDIHLAHLKINLRDVKNKMHHPG